MHNSEFPIAAESMSRSKDRTKCMKVNESNGNIELLNKQHLEQEISHSAKLARMKLSTFLLKGLLVEGWDGPWDGINAMTDN